MTGIPREEAVLRAKQIVQREAEAVRAFAAQLDDSLADVLSLMLNCEGHVLVTGAGTSRAIAQRLAHLLSCSGTPSLFISASDGLHGGSGAVTENDVVYLISKGGHSAEINQFAKIARSRGAKLIAQTENPGSPLAQMCDAVFKVKAEGDVDPYGMVATGSSLVNGAAGDVLCVLLLELRGYTKDAFGQTHPGGAVGKKLVEEQS
ncbi:MAG: SIS domain-containing protein [Anaerolineae bacterium]|nr:SIS domain-containing protein [Anaerolineae bacterium]